MRRFRSRRVLIFIRILIGGLKKQRLSRPHWMQSRLGGGIGYNVTAVAATGRCIGFNSALWLQLGTLAPGRYLCSGSTHWLWPPTLTLHVGSSPALWLWLHVLALAPHSHPAPWLWLHLSALTRHISFGSPHWLWLTILALARYIGSGSLHWLWLGTLALAPHVGFYLAL